MRGLGIWFCGVFGFTTVGPLITAVGFTLLGSGGASIAPAPTATVTPTPVVITIEETTPSPSPSPMPTPFNDNDYDGHPNAYEGVGDCNDFNNAVYPGAWENPATRDNEDCDPNTVDFADLDGDGYANAAVGGNDEDDSRTECAPACPPPPPPAPYIWPVYGSINTYFGYGHNGIDIGAGCGTAIAASASGTVVFLGWNGGYGNQVIIDHGGTQTRYAHLSAFWVGHGQYVGQGEGIGAVGTTGYSTGCHLHFELLIGGRFGDPLGYLP